MISGASELNGDQRPTTILVVDDKNETRQAIIAYLEFEGYVIKEADDGHKALALLSDFKPDLVLLDGMMPGLDGVDVLKAIRDNPAICELPVIMVTARGESHEVARALKAGASDYFIKPVQLEVLVNRVRSLLRLRRLEEQVRRDEERLKRLNILTDLTLQVVSVEGSETVRRAAEEMRALMTDLLTGRVAGWEEKEEEISTP